MPVDLSYMVAVQQLLNQQEQERQAQERQRQQQAAGGGEGGGEMSPSSAMSAYNNYNRFNKMFGNKAEAPAAAPAAYEAPAMGSTPAATSAFGGAGELGGTAGLEGGAGGASSYASLPLGYIAAGIIGQHMMSSGTDRRTNSGGKASKDSGHRTGDIFSGNFFTEPWMAYGQQQLGVDAPTPGEKTDAAIDRTREGKGGFSDLMSTVPSTAYQWFDPVGTFADNVMGDKFGTIGKIATKALLPHTMLKDAADWIGKLF